ncbi:hypothetical protein C8J56DRAFT_879948 [Mycena floridula]|nr:hypothetical protein C8J56DRAFT_879948 [Mycena floridula]
MYLPYEKADRINWAYESPTVMYHSTIIPMSKLTAWVSSSYENPASFSVLTVFVSPSFQDGSVPAPSFPASGRKNLAGLTLSEYHFVLIMYCYLVIIAARFISDPSGYSFRAGTWAAG